MPDLTRTELIKLIAVAPKPEPGGESLNLQGVDLAGLDLHGLDLSYVTLANADLAGCNLRCARMVHAALAGATFDDADMTGIIMEGSYGNETTFRRAKFGPVYPEKDEDERNAADLEDCLFRDCDFTGADLSRARVARSDFRGSVVADAIIDGVNWLTVEAKKLPRGIQMFTVAPAGRGRAA